MGVPIAGYEGFYTVDECGNVFSVRSRMFLKQNTNTCGYKSVELFNAKGKSKRLLVHRIVASAFVPNPLNLPQVNHKDENKANNRASNLEWVTAKQNMNYGTAKERRKRSMEWYYKSRSIKDVAKENGKNNSKPVLQFSKDGRLIAKYASGKEASRATGANHSHILECCNGKRYKTVSGYIWKFDRKD